jgi:hypothetical protein
MLLQWTDTDDKIEAKQRWLHQRDRNVQGSVSVGVSSRRGG